MHIKFLKHGRGSTVKAVKYLMQEFDSNENIREVVEVMDGTPELFASMCDSLTFSHRYSSAVVRWHHDDCPTPAQFQEVLDDFKRVALGGVNAPFLAVRHDDHLHILIGRVDLETGKAFNPAPPGWERDFDPLRDYYNAKYEWARPDDPARARVFTFSRGEGSTQAKDREQAKIDITNHIGFLIEKYQIKNRDDIVAELAKIGEVTRQTKNSISIILEGFTKPLRLTGAYYEQSFSGITGEVTREKGRSRADNQQRVRELQGEFESRVRKRTEYNENRFKAPEHEKLDIWGRDSRADARVRNDFFYDAENGRVTIDERSKQTIVSNDVEQDRGADRFDQPITTPYISTAENTDYNKREQVNEPTDTVRNPIAELIAKINSVARATKRLATATVNTFNEYFERRAETTRNLATASANLNTASAEINSVIEQFRQTIKESYLERKSIAQQVKQLEQLEFEQKNKTRSYDMDM